jgi:hypothetical protein
MCRTAWPMPAWTYVIEGPSPCSLPGEDDGRDDVDGIAMTRRISVEPFCK